MQINKLIIAEKPSVALRLALSLGDGRPKTNYLNGVRYYEITQKDGLLYIVAAAGHLFTIRQRSGNALPVFDVEWIESFKVNKSAYYTKKYLDTIESVGRSCSIFINACDYDIEGTVIGTNIIKYIINRDVNKEIATDNAKRMKFSTTTRSDLLESYKNVSSLDSTNFYAGETRHKLDWMWGINMSRALMKALSTAGARKILSIGRVQGPALAILAERENEIKKFVPKPYWKIEVIVKGVRFDNKKERVFEKNEAQRIFEKTKNKELTVESVESKERSSRPFPPFDLTSMQIEANRVFGIDPSKTLAIAQSLYERSYISYPRTSSQKLPLTLNLPRIINALATNEKYKELAGSLISSSRFKPAEGIKEDEAHPAIYPTGEMPSKLTPEEEKVYDLIVRRFLSCFADYASITTNTVTLLAGDERYTASGDRIKYRGWLDFYTYYKPRTLDMPIFTQGEKVKSEKTELKSLMTEPPRRFTKASLIALLEEKDLGTKATRAEIIDTLFKREYIKGGVIEVTGFGLATYNALNLYCRNILDEQLTRTLETDMNNITKGSMSRDEVIKEGKEIITNIIKSFTKNEREIGKELIKGLQESEISNRIGVCKSSGGNLILRRSRAGKNFIGCSDWPKCTVTYSVPQGAKIVHVGKNCEICGTPKIKVFRKGKRPFEMDLDPNCPTKKDWGKPKEELEIKTGSEIKEKGLEAKAVPQEKIEKHAKKTRKKKAEKIKTKAKKK